MDARIHDLPFDPAALQRPVGRADRQPPPEQLRRRGQAPQRDPRPSCAESRRCRRARFPAQRPEARGAHRHQLDAAARAVLRRAWAATGRRWSRRGAGAGGQLRQRRSAGATSSSPWARRSAAARAGCCWCSSRARARWSTNGRPTTRTRWPAACRSWRWTCTNTPTTSTTAPPPGPMSMPSWPTSTGPASTRATRRPCTRPASPSARRRTRSPAPCCSTCAAPACSNRRRR